MAKFTFAIMGATGHIGHVLTEELLKKGHKVRALGRDGHKLKELKAKGAEVHSGNFTDEKLLAKAFKGCNAVFTFIPPDHEGDVEVFKDHTSEAIAHALVKAKISHVVNLSSMGANLSSGTGLIKALHLNEERLNSVPNLNVLHFRPNFFMENLLSYLPNNKNSGSIVTPIKADLYIPMVATHDIALKIAEFLNTLKFTGSSVFEFVGPHEVTMKEATKIIGKALGKPNLKYVQVSYQEAEEAMIDSGMKHQLAKLLVDMCKAFNEGKIKATQQLTAEHKGKTTFEEFAKNLSHTYRSSKKAA